MIKQTKPTGGDNTNCIKCKETMKYGVQVNTTNIGFLVVTDDKLYDNDDRPVMVCTNTNCTNLGLLQVSLPIFRADKEENHDQH